MLAGEYCPLKKKRILRVYPVAHLAFVARSPEDAEAFQKSRKQWAPSSPVPVEDRLSVSHRCSNAGCVNPKHLCLEPMRVNCDRANCQLHGIVKTADGKFEWICPHNPPCIMTAPPRPAPAPSVLNVDPAWAQQEPQEPGWRTTRGHHFVAARGAQI